MFLKFIWVRFFIILVIIEKEFDIYIFIFRGCSFFRKRLVYFFFKFFVGFLFLERFL